MYELHAHPLRRHYAATLCSGAMLVQILVFGFLLTIPYLASYRTDGMWIQEAEYREQPEIHYKHKLVLFARGGGGGTELVYSTFPNFNFLAQASLRIPSIKSRELDGNGDGLPDSLTLDLTLPLQEGEDVSACSLVLFFDLQLHDHVRLQMETAALVQYEAGGGASSMGGASLVVAGSLKWRQDEPLPYSAMRYDYNASIVDDASMDPSDYSLPTILETYAARNESTYFEQVGAVWTATRAAGSPFRLSASIKYPSALIRYRPSMLQEAKHGWIQILAFLLPLWFVAGRLQDFLFAHRVVIANTWDDAPLRKMQ